VNVALPPACSSGITEITATLFVEADGLSPAEPMHVLHRFDRDEPLCRNLYRAMDIAYQDLRATYDALTRAATTTPIEGPADLRALQERYFEAAAEDKPGSVGEAAAVALVKLNQALAETPVEGPIDLWWISQRYHLARRCYDSYRM
jgi:hypothetical protein